MFLYMLTFACAFFHQVAYFLGKWRSSRKGNDSIKDLLKDFTNCLSDKIAATAMIQAIKKKFPQTI